MFVDENKTSSALKFLGKKSEISYHLLAFLNVTV